MKPVTLLVWFLAVAPLSRVQASPERSLAPAAAPPPATAAPKETVAPRAETPRRSRLVESGDDKPVFHLTVTSFDVGRDQAKDDHCLQSTGSRLRREGSGSAACAGSGQVFVPER